jgi:hypothetical protein
MGHSIEIINKKTVPYNYILVITWDTWDIPLKSLEELIPGQDDCRNFGETETDGIRAEMFECIQSAHRVIESMFACLDDEITRQMVKEFMAGPQLKAIEQSIDTQIRIVMDSGSDEERDAALDRVKEGMAYWKNLVLRRIRAKSHFGAAA